MNRRGAHPTRARALDAEASRASLRCSPACPASRPRRPRASRRFGFAPVRVTPRARPRRPRTRVSGRPRAPLGDGRRRARVPRGGVGRRQRRSLGSAGGVRARRGGARVTPQRLRGRGGPPLQRLPLRERPVRVRVHPEQRRPVHRRVQVRLPGRPEKHRLHLHPKLSPRFDALRAALRGDDSASATAERRSDVVPGGEPTDAEVELMSELRDMLGQLSLSNDAIWERERARPEVPAPWIIKAPYFALCYFLDLVFRKMRPCSDFGSSSRWRGCPTSATTRC